MIDPPTDFDLVGDGLRTEGVLFRLENIYDYESEGHHPVHLKWVRGWKSRVFASKSMFPTKGIKFIVYKVQLDSTTWQQVWRRRKWLVLLDHLMTTKLKTT
jgi:hypothetical protein